jgi:SAM-dependent methyltransferase
MIATQELKLNLGAIGEVPHGQNIPGFTTVDVREGAEVRCPLDKLPFEDGSASELYCSHCLEHFSHTRTIEVLKEWHRVLKPGGKAYISVPCWDQILKIIQKAGFLQWTRFLLWGDQRDPFSYHYIVFNYPLLAGNLASAGFKDVRKIASMPYGLDDASRATDCIYGIPISLNVEAIA